MHAGTITAGAQHSMTVSSTMCSSRDTQHQAHKQDKLYLLPVVEPTAMLAVIWGGIKKGCCQLTLEALVGCRGGECMTWAAGVMN